MSDAPYEIVHVSELDAIPVGDTGLVWHPVRRRLGIRAFGMNAYTAEAAGKEVVEDHTESRFGHEEVYFVASGRARFTLGEEEVDAPAGTFVYLRDPGTRRHAVADEEGTVVLAVGGKPGEAFTVSAWEFFFAGSPHARAGDFAKAADVTAEGLTEVPDNPALLYNLACYEAQAGRTDAAIEHVSTAIELDEYFREYAREDADLDSIRDDPRFVSAIAGQPDPGSPGT